MGDRWGHSIHYHDALVAPLGTGLRRVLDVGCGDGYLSLRLREVADQVVGLEPHGPSLELAQRRHSAPGVTFVQGDMLDAPFPDGSFDAVTCVMALHHVDEEVALQRLAELVRPGGHLGVIGCGRRTWRDLPWDAIGFVAHRVLRRRRAGSWPQESPMVWPPPHTWLEVRELAERTLPGSRYERKVLFRYVLTWTKPS